MAVYIEKIYNLLDAKLNLQAKNEILMFKYKNNLLFTELKQLNAYFS